MNFTEFGFDNDLMDGIHDMGYENATPVQEQVIPVIIEGRDVIAAAQTGTGKTAAFLLPIIQKLISQPHENHLVNAIIIVPTRELCTQITQTLEGISYYTSISFIAVYGGTGGAPFANEKKALSSGVDIVICTPGRMISHLNMGYVNLSGVSYMILDEADRMLDMGFYDDIIKITSFLPPKRQNLLFSATMPPAIRKLAKTILHNPVEVNIAISKPPELIDQKAYFLYEAQKTPLLKLITQDNAYSSILVFCSSKESVRLLSAELKKTGFSVGQIQSGLEQDIREQTLLDFKNHKIRTLIATDILSRGIDIEDIDLVVNFDVPHDGEDYVHRIGRTARAASKGAAITFITPKDARRFTKIEQLIDRHVPRLPVPDSFGASPDPSEVRAPDLKRKKKRNFKKR